MGKRSAASAEYPSIDVHAHVVPPFVGRDGDLTWLAQGHPLARTPDGALVKQTPTGPRPETYKFDAESVTRRLDYMNTISLDVQVLSLMPAMWHYSDDRHDVAAAARRSNDYLIEISSQNRERIRCFAHLPLFDPPAAITELRRVMESPMVVGAAVGTHVAGMHWDDPYLLPILEAAADTGAVLFFHPAQGRLAAELPRYYLANSIGNPTETTIAVADVLLGGVLARLPRLATLFAHGGGYAALAMARLDHAYREECTASASTSEVLLSNLDRMYFDSIVHDDRILRLLIDTVGIGQVVLGSDYPAAMGTVDPVATISGTRQLSAAEQRAIVSSNAARLIGW